MGLRFFALSLLLSGFFTSHSQRLYEDRINVRSEGAADYRDAVIYLPANFSKNKAYPLVLFTHGIGESGTNIKKLYNQGAPKVLKEGYRPPFDFIMVAVQRNSFSVLPEWLPGILKDCQKRWNIDDSRIYLTGISAGGWAVYGSQLDLTKTFGKKFAAIVINSGHTQNSNKKHLDWWKETKTPLWAIVGGADKSYVARNAVMVKQINKRVPKLATLTVRSGIGHGGWTDVYNGNVKLNGKNIWQWMYQFKRAADGTVITSGKTSPDSDEGNADDKGSAATQYIKVNIYKGANPYEASAWNNWNVGAVSDSNIHSDKFNYSNGKRSSIEAVLSSSYRVVDNREEYDGGMAPAEVLRYTSYATHKRTLTLSGLSRSKTYALVLYSSRRMRPGNTTVFSINGEHQPIATNENHTDRAKFSQIRPDANGRIVVTIENRYLYNYINGFILTEEP